MARAVSRCLAVLVIGFLALTACGGGGGGSTSSSGGPDAQLVGTWRWSKDANTTTLVITSDGRYTYSLSFASPTYACSHSGTQTFTSTQFTLQATASDCPETVGACDFNSVTYNYTVDATTAHFSYASGGCGSDPDSTWTRAS